MRRLLILHDSPDFGGHERMLLALLPGMLERGDFDDIVFMVPEQNQRLADRLAAELPAIRVMRWPFVKRRGEPYLGQFRWRYRRAVRAIVAREQPNTVLLVQGRIENLVVPMLALDARINVVSYVPMAHRLTQMGRAGFPGDLVRRRLYRRPDRFIVPARSVVKQVRLAGGSAPVTVATNSVEMPPMVPQDEARAALGLAGGKRIALFLGRLEMAQKGLDVLLGALERSAAGALSGWTFVFVGDGPDRAWLETALAKTRVDARLVAWTDDPQAYLAAADVLLMPSRFEGLPLVMLEAMQGGLPILASDIDVAREYLPAGSRIDFASADLAAVLDKVTDPAGVAAYRDASRAMLAPQTLAAAQAEFAAALVA